jgi:hypothetical protein
MGCNIKYGGESNANHFSPMHSKKYHQRSCPRMVDFHIIFSSMGFFSSHSEDLTQTGWAYFLTGDGGLILC